ncbi:hypothetical protein HY339_02780 [Candidatus Gottesmanbacteria bacterium]|nr:hypothetical protein [Candidatus Gottesmanbacteria bacterium]
METEAHHTCIELDPFFFSHSSSEADRVLRYATGTVIEAARKLGLHPAVRGGVLDAHLLPGGRDRIVEARSAVHASRMATSCGPFPALPEEPLTPPIGACDIVIDGNKHDLKGLLTTALSAVGADAGGVIFSQPVGPPQSRRLTPYEREAYAALKPEDTISIGMKGAPERSDLPLITVLRTTDMIGVPVDGKSPLGIGTRQYSTDAVFVAPLHHPHQRRTADWTSNVDALRAPVHFANGTLCVDLPSIPPCVGFSPEALANFQRGAHTGDRFTVEATVDAALRTVRKAATFALPFFSDTACDRLQGIMSVIAKRFYCSPIQLQKLCDEVYAAIILNPENALTNLALTGAHHLFPPGTAAVLGCAALRQQAIQAVLESLDNHRKSNWPPGAIPSVIRGAIALVVYGTTAVFPPDPLRIQAETL